MAMEAKCCCRCGDEFPATAEFFIRNKNSRDGLTSQCRSCRALMWRAQYEKNRAHYITKSTASTRSRRQRDDVKERERIASREAKRLRLADPVEREKHRHRTREWFRKNRDQVRAMPSRDKALRAHYTARRTADQLLATPPWTDLDRIAAFYREAKRLTEATGVPHEVDHIVPLRHPAASGLHVPENLRVVTRAENRSKSNRVISL